MTSLRALLAAIFRSAAVRLDPASVQPMGNRTWLRAELDDLNAAPIQLPNLPGLIERPARTRR